MPPPSAIPAGGSVQQDLSAAGGALGFYQLGLAADERYSLGGMPAKRLNTYSAKRYVIACEGAGVRSKLFQIAFAASDASLFVTFPYFSGGLGRVGLVTLNTTMTYPADLTVGQSFPVTSHYVKYSHHPSGRAHFSLSGKVRSSVGRAAVPLRGANGHIFTVMNLFSAVSAT